jgi:L-serine kinase (ADP)
LKVKLRGEKAIDLGFVHLEDTKPHEATIPALVESVERDMHRTGFQRDPILIDDATNIALDGMHRRAALLSFGAKYVLCARYNYLNPEVKLGRWLRYMVMPSEKLVANITSLLHMRKCDRLEGARLVNAGEAGVALLSSAHSFVADGRGDIQKIYESVGEVDKLCEAERVQVQFASDDHELDLYSSESVYVLYPASLAKSDIISIIERGGRLPHKTTRHTVPIRPMGIYFPLEMLVGAEQSDCERELERVVSLSNIEVGQGNTWYEGRLYSDPIAIFRRHF